MKLLEILVLVVMLSTGLVACGDNSHDERDEILSDGDEDNSEDTNPNIKRSGPGRAGRIAEITGDIPRLRGTTFGKSIAQTNNRKGRKEAGGIAIDFSGITPNFGTLFIPTIPLWPVGSDADNCITPKIIQVNTDSSYNQFVDLTGMCTYAFETEIVVEDIVYKEALGLLQDTLEINGDIYYSNNHTDKILKFSPSGEQSVFVNEIPCVNSLVLSDGEIFASVAPSRINDVQQYPKIVKLNEDGTYEDFFVFPENLLYMTGYEGMLNSPLGFVMDFVIVDEVIYVTHNLENKVYKAEPSTQTLTEFATDLPGVSGISYNQRNEHFYVATTLVQTVELGTINTPTIYAISKNDGVLTPFYAFPSYTSTVGFDIENKPIMSVQVDIDDSENIYIADSNKSTLTGIQIVYSPECDPTLEEPCSTVFESDEATDGDSENEISDSEGSLPLDGICLPSAESALGGYCLNNCWQNGEPDKTLCNGKEICQPIYGATKAYCSYPCSTNNNCAIGESCQEGICFPESTEDGDEIFADGDEDSPESETADGDAEEEIENSADGDEAI